MNKAYWSKIGEMFARLCVAVPCGFVTLEQHEQGFAVFHWRAKIRGKVFHCSRAVDDLRVAEYGEDVDTVVELIAERWRWELDAACSPGEEKQ